MPQVTTRQMIRTTATGAWPAAADPELFDLDPDTGMESTADDEVDSSLRSTADDAVGGVRRGSTSTADDDVNVADGVATTTGTRLIATLSRMTVLRLLVACGNSTVATTRAPVEPATSVTVGHPNLPSVRACTAVARPRDSLANVVSVGWPSSSPSSTSWTQDASGCAAGRPAAADAADATKGHTADAEVCNSSSSGAATGPAGAAAENLDVGGDGDEMRDSASLDDIAGGAADAVVGGGAICLQRDCLFLEPAFVLFGSPISLKVRSC